MSEIYYSRGLDIEDCDITLHECSFSKIDNTTCAIHLDTTDVSLTSKLDYTLGFTTISADIIHSVDVTKYSSDEVLYYLNKILLNTSEAFLK